MIEEQVPQDHVLLTIPGVGRLAAGIVGDVKRFPRAGIICCLLWS